MIVVDAGKPAFFTEDRPVRRARRQGNPLLKSPGGPFQRGRVYSGGNIKDFQERARASGDRVLFVGDHIYGDMLRSRKSSNWRTAMILQELEHEVTTHDRLRPEVSRLDRLDGELNHLDSELNERQAALRALQKTSGEAPDPAAAVRQARHQGGDRAAAPRAARDRRPAPASSRTTIDDGFNPYWGPMFREGYEVSKFGEQVEAYACVYTSRVSNFRFYSPMQYFRGPRDRMPHER